MQVRDLETAWRQTASPAHHFHWALPNVLDRWLPTGRSSAQKAPKSLINPENSLEMPISNRILVDGGILENQTGNHK